MAALLSVFKRELTGYFATPVAYVFIVIFLVLTGTFTFAEELGGFYERGQADLQPFFGFHPWLYLFLIPALSMRLWAEERRGGTIELLLTLPIFYPVSQHLGFDPLWFGVLVVIAMEMALITPPVGLNLYVIRGVAPQVPLPQVLLGSMPFVIIMLLFMVLLSVFPEIALWLPDTLMGPGS